MTRRAFLEKYFVRFAVSLALVGLIAYTVYHVFGTSSKSLLTTPARRINDFAVIGGEGYLFREERVLTVPSPGVIRDLAESGAKVSSGGALVEVYGGYAESELADAQRELERLEEMIAVLEESQAGAGTALAKAEAMRQEAVNAYRLICASASRGEISQISELSDRMLILLNRYGSLTDPTFDTAAMLKGLTAERDAFLKGAGLRVVNEGTSGYFYGYDMVDGYEEMFTLDALDALGVDSFAALKQAQPTAAQGFTVGKTVHGNRWYLAMDFDSDEKEFIAEGGEYTFTFPENRDKEIGMVCHKIVDGVDGGIIAVFASDEVPTDFVWKRCQSARITVGSTTGYYVPDSALYTVDGVECVYVLEGGTVYLRRVEILYRGDGYCIVAEQGDRGGDYLALNDLMVTSGGDLYDGRVFR